MAAPILALAAAAAVAVSFTCANAEPVVVGLHLGSVHVPHRIDQRNVNPGAYVRFGNGLTLGAYRNTLGRESVYAGYTFNVIGRIDLTLGAVTGYERKVVARYYKPVCADGNPGPCTLTKGFTRHRVGLLVAPSIRLPGVAGFTPRLSALAGDDAVAIHLSVERAI